MNKIIGNKLKILRQSKNLSQEQLADFLHISLSAYARMERGESTSWASHFNRICEVFEITPEELVKNEGVLNEKEDFVNIEYETQSALLNAYRKILEKYEGQIIVLKAIIEDLKRSKE
ncbi:helix-turn-helix domain-containing protein [Flavobacterium sp. CLA17]|uniref:helix-turn-helix domain-containing protein n=1 Tax=Flavobacterium sp. CLA17 TaxID=2724135 RepID=UPI001492FFD9|nr:helix-turn-helix transcriptional regulator [Flavobacterium sp. CLA17]QSB27750.1 helix-turn-helix transcriptional regulator [Flavobacterium sp. CLA17]